MTPAEAAPASGTAAIARPVGGAETHSPLQGQRLEEIVFGTLDGVITSLALIVSVAGVLALATVVSNRFVFLAVTAGTFGGALSMFVGALLSSRSRKNLIRREREREEREVVEKPEEEREEVRAIFRHQGFSESETDILVRGVCSNPKLWVDFMMRDELHLPPEDEPQPFTHGIVIGLAYLLGGILPALPFLFLSDVRAGLFAAIGVGGLQLSTIGFLEARYAGMSRFRGAGEILLIGLATAFAVFLITSLLQTLPA